MNLGRLPNLQAIMLAGTAITDDGLKELAEFKSLQIGQSWPRTSVTEEGTRRLREARPDIQIIDGLGVVGVWRGWRWWRGWRGWRRWRRWRRRRRRRTTW